MNTKPNFGSQLWKHFRRSLVLRISVFVMCLIPAQGLPQISTVTNCTEAVLRAALAGGGTVGFACDGTITLTNTILITTNTVLDGTGHQVTISGANAARVFYVSSNVTFTVASLTVAYGQATYGAGIYNDGGTLSASATVFQANTAGFSGSGQGGAVWNGGSAGFSNCTFAGNRAAGGINGNDGMGGAIYSLGTLTVRSCSFYQNVAFGGGGAAGLPSVGYPGGNGVGGAIYSLGSLTINGSTFATNNATGGRGSDAVLPPYLPGGGGDAKGGGLFTGGTAAVFDCTFVANSASGGDSGRQYPNAGRADGSAVYGSTTPALVNCTIAQNSATSRSSAGGAVTGVTMVNSILAYNTPFNSSSWSPNASHNLSSDGTPQFADPSNQNNVDPKIGPLAGNGGPTLTMALAPGSRALDAGDDSVLAPPYNLLVDERGYARRSGQHVDIGAFEVQWGTTNGPPFISLSPQSQAICPCSPVDLEVIASGAPPLSYQWFFNSTTPVAGATTAHLRWSCVRSSDIGTYSVVITNAFGAATSSPAALSFLPCTVTSLASSGPGTLTDAISNAPRGGTITFAVTGTIPGGTTIARDLNIVGPGASNLAISGGASVFTIRAGANVLISGLTIRDGITANGADGVILGGPPGTASPGWGGDPGGGIYNAGTLALRDCVVAYNRTGHGGAGVSGNYQWLVSAGGPGGDGAGIYNAGNLTVSNCVISGNGTGYGGNSGHTDWSPGSGAGGCGGGIYNQGTLRLDDCTISGNGTGTGGAGLGASASGGFGAGIWSQGSLTANHCTFNGNATGPGGQWNLGPVAPGGNGGAIWCSGTVTLTNCTLSGNLAASGGMGGGIYCSGDLSLVACTVAANQAGLSWPGNGAGLYAGGATPPRLLNTIVALSAGGIADVAGSFTSLGHNLIGITNGCSGFTAPGDLTGSGIYPLDPKLGSLANNGGPTLTTALAFGSPALDGGDDAVLAAPYKLATDQRGFPRLSGAHVDIGAFEAQAPPVSPPLILVPPQSQSVFAGSSVDFSVTATGSAPLAYQWFFDGTVLSGATNSNLHLTNVQSSQAGGYAVVVTNIAGWVTTLDAILSLVPVTFSNDTTFTLSSTIQVATDTVVDANGHRVTLSGGNQVRLFYVPTNVTLTLLNLTIANGYSSNGAGIFNDGGTLNLLGITFQSNSASLSRTDPNIPVEGGAIFNRGGTVNATNCVFSSNAASQPVNTLSQAGTVAAPAVGGAIRNESGDVNLHGCNFVGNQACGSSGTGSTPQNGSAGCGGAIHNSDTLNVANCRFESNAAKGGTAGSACSGCGGPAGVASGGAIHNAGLLALRGSLFLNNSALGGQGSDATSYGGWGVSGGTAYGGALCNLGALTASGSTFIGNSAVGGVGGAGFGGGPPGPYPSSGQSGGWGGSGGAANGGGMFSGGVTILWNSTFAFNTAVGAAGGNGGMGGMANADANSGPGGNGGNGGSGFGAICDTNGMCSITNCTLAFNSGIGSPGGSGGAPGGGIYPGSHGSPGRNGSAAGGISSVGAFLVNTLLASNAPGSNCAGTISDAGHNLSSDNTPAFASPGSRNLTDPLLGPLADNGGPTPSMALVPGSPAIDAGESTAAPSWDQRGFPRPVGVAADIGAYEYGTWILRFVRPQAGTNDVGVYGLTGAACKLLTTTNLTEWSPISTNQIGADGSPLLRVTVNPVEPSRFYRVAVP